MTFTLFFEQESLILKKSTQFKTRRKVGSSVMHLTNERCLWRFKAYFDRYLILKVNHTSSAVQSHSLRYLFYYFLNYNGDVSHDISVKLLLFFPVVYINAQT